MKKIAYTISWIVLVFNLTSCSDFLKEDVRDFRSSDNFYVDEASLKTGLYGVYQNYNALYRAYEPFIGELGSDESVGQFYHQVFNQMYKYNMTSNHTVVSNWYDLHYALICKANTMIDRAPTINNVSEEVARTMVAECRAMRAWAYFRLVQTLGPVPLLIGETTSIDARLPRSPLKDIYKWIVDDLEYAAQDGVLPVEKQANEPQRITSYVAKAMLGKVYLTLASSKEAGVIDRLMQKAGKEGYGYGGIEESVIDLYKKAENVLNQIIGKIELQDEYGDLFLVEKKNTFPENMWEIQFSAIEPTGSYFLKVYGMMSFPFLFERDMLTNGSGLCQIYYSPDMWTSYKEGDKRKNWNLTDRYMDYKYQDTDTFHIVFDPIDAHTDGVVQTWLGVTKFRFVKGAAFNAPISYGDYFHLPMNFTVIRYADVLLMYAEANLKAHNGKATQEGVNAINAVRNRARGKLVSASDTPEFPNYTTGTLTLENIMEERKLELCFESIRWFDLVRWGNLVEKYQEPVVAGDFKQADTFKTQFEFSFFHDVFKG
ncbi:membrane protein [Clostridia bacterium]|nr:membrane protein [Clostridia bacterium]